MYPYPHMLPPLPGDSDEEWSAALDAAYWTEYTYLEDWHQEERRAECAD